VELARLLAFGDQRANASAGEERWDAGAAGTKLLGERALRRELELELAGQVLALELLVLADVARDHLLDLARLEQLAEAEAVDAGVVRDDGQVLDARIVQRIDQGLGNAAQAEAADGHQLAIADDAGQGGGRAWEDLVHRRIRGVESARLSVRALPRMAEGRTRTMDVAALQATLDSLAAECVKRLGMRVETVEPGQVTLSLPVSAEIVHAGGVVCGQAILAAADTAMLVAMIAQL